MDVTEQLAELKVRALGELADIDDARELESWRVCYLGKKSRLSVALRNLGTLLLTERKNVGAAANSLRVELESSLEQKEQALREAKLVSSVQKKGFDVSLPGYPFP